MFQSEGVANGQNPFTHFQIIRVAQRSDLQVDIRVDFDYGDVGLGISTYQFSLELLVIRKSDDDLIPAFDDMIVGQNVAFFIHDEARTQTLLPKGPPGHGITKETAPEFAKGVLFSKGTRRGWLASATRLTR